MPKTTPAKDQDQFIVRLPDGMRDRIKSAASDNNRSMNAEIVATLEEKYPAPLSSDESVLMGLLMSVSHSDALEFLSVLKEGRKMPKDEGQLHIREFLAQPKWVEYAKKYAEQS